MQIDNPRKRCRGESDDGDHVAKKTRQLDQNAPTRDCDSTPPSPGAESESAPSTPASIDMDLDMDDAFPVQTPQPKSPPRARGTIISGWNQAQRSQYLNQGYPFSWMQNSTQVSIDFT